MSVAQRVAQARARLARERGAGEQTGNPAGSASGSAGTGTGVEPGILPNDIAPDPAHVEAARAQAGASSKGANKTDPGAKTREAVSGLDFRLNQFGQLMYCYRTQSGKFVVIPAESVAALDAIALVVFEASGATPSHEVLKRELAPIRARARQVGRTIHVHNRIAPDGHGGYLIDVGNDTGEAVHVTAVGWAVQPNHDVAFRRGGGYGELLFSHAQRPPAQAWELLTGWLTAQGVRPKVAPVVAVMLVEWLRPNTPNPIAEIVGGAGSGKTTLANHLAALVDPTTAGGLPSTSLNEKDAGAAVSNRYVLGFDNAGGPLSDDAQDLLCKVATGTVLASRLLYAQADEFMVGVRAPEILTAVVSVITRADARSRTVQIKVGRRGHFTGAGNVESEFNAMRPGLTGAMLTLLSAGIAGLSEARKRTYTHRLVDFEQLGESITTAVGWQPGQFQEAMLEHRREVAEESADATPVVLAVRKLISELGAKAQPGTKPPAGVGRTLMQYAYTDPDNTLHVGVMLKGLHARVTTTPGGSAYSNERSTKNALAVHAPTLAALGIEFSTGNVKAGTLVEFRTNGRGKEACVDASSTYKTSNHAGWR